MTSEQTISRQEVLDLQERVKNLESIVYVLTDTFKQLGAAFVATSESAKELRKKFPKDGFQLFIVLPLTDGSISFTRTIEYDDIDNYHPTYDNMYIAMVTDVGYISSQYCWHRTEGWTVYLGDDKRRLSKKEFEESQNLMPRI